MPIRQPVLFVSHGSPDILLRPGRTGALWQALGQSIPRPEAILAVSAHWEAPFPTVGGASRPETIHDFGGFPRALYEIQYSPPGAAFLADRVKALLEDGGLAASIDRRRGLDHGAWVPLMMMYPDVDIPVTQVSVSPRAGPAWHRRLGALLAPLRDEGILILGSGAVTHNFGWLGAADAPPYPPAVAFADWLGQTLASGSGTDLLEYRALAPYGKEAHPTEEHLLPLIVAWGATDEEDVLQRLVPEFTHGGLAMDAYLWHAAELPVMPAANWA